MKKLLYLGLALVLNTFVACKGSPDEETDTDTNGIDSLDTIDTLDTLGVMDSAGYVNDSMETETIIEAIYGEQWEFCDCVVKNDSINTVLEEAGDDADYDAILERMDVIDQHCKNMLTTANTTPDERAKHERRVSKCLRDAR